MKIIGGRPAKEWHSTIFNARFHSIMGWFILVSLWATVGSLTYVWIDREWIYVAYLGFSTMMHAWALNFGFRAMWDCKRHNIDYNKHWSEQ